MKSDAVWIVGGGALQVPVVREAYRQGFDVIISDMDAKCVALQEGQVAHFVHLDTYNVKEHVKRFKDETASFNLKGVLTAGADVAPTVAALAEQGGLPGLDYSAASRSHDKARVRYALEDSNMNRYQPSWHYYDVTTYRMHSDPLSFIISAIRAQYTAGKLGNDGIVIKPLSKSGSRGVTIIPPAGMKKPDWLRVCIEKALQYGREFIVEERLRGTEHSCEILLGSDGCLIYNSVVDRPFDYTGGIAMELGHVSPSNLNPNDQSDVVGMVVQAANALEVNFGAFKCDVIMTKNGPRILEATARLSGGFDCSYTTPIATGRNPIGALIRLSTGQEPILNMLQAQYGGYAACVASFPAEGIVEAIQGNLFIEPTIDEIRNGGVLSLITCEPGDRLSYEHCAKRAAFSIVGAKTYDEAWSRGCDAAKRTAARIHMLADPTPLALQ